MAMRIPSLPRLALVAVFGCALLWAAAACMTAQAPLARPGLPTPSAPGGAGKTYRVGPGQQFVRIGEQRFDFAAGDALVTGVASLYSSDEFITLARDAGLVLEKVWNDERLHLGLHWMKAA